MREAGFVPTQSEARTMQQAIQNHAQMVGQHIDAVRRAALEFAKSIEAAQPEISLVDFDPFGLFEQAVKKGYEVMRDGFIRSRTHGNLAPEIDDMDIRQSFKRSLKAESRLALSEMNVIHHVNVAMSELDNLLPEAEAEAENEVNAQLAARAWAELGLQHQNFVEKAGRVVLSYNAYVDSITKKFSKRNDYSWSCREAVQKRALVLRDLVIQFNFEREKNYSTAMPGWSEFDDACKHICRAPNVIQAFGSELKVRVSSYEWHLPRELAEFISEFISLHNRR